MPNTSSGVAHNVNTNNERSIEKEIETIINVFPDYGDGYVRKLLERYENPEAVIAAVLEGLTYLKLIFNNLNNIFCFR